LVVSERGSKWAFRFIGKTERRLTVRTVGTEMAGARQFAFSPKQRFEIL
jgi:hypothetical protein